jgi:hypothetical protein
MTEARPYESNGFHAKRAVMPHPGRDFAGRINRKVVSTRQSVLDGSC